MKAIIFFLLTVTGCCAQGVTTDTIPKYLLLADTTLDQSRVIFVKGYIVRVRKENSVSLQLDDIVAILSIRKKPLSKGLAIIGMQPR